MFSKIKIKIQKIGTEYLGLVCSYLTSVQNYPTSFRLRVWLVSLYVTLLLEDDWEIFQWTDKNKHVPKAGHHHRQWTHVLQALWRRKHYGGGYRSVPYQPLVSHVNTFYYTNCEGTTGNVNHTAPWLLEGTLRRTYRGFHSFRSSIGRNLNLLVFRDCLTALFLIPDFLILKQRILT